jgi:hypothetical protein
LACVKTLIVLESTRDSGIAMSFGEDYLKIVGQIGNFTKEVTGMSVIDSYFGPKKFSQEESKMRLNPAKLLMELDELIDRARDIGDELRRIVVTSDLESLKSVVRWLSGEDIPYTRLVEGIFGITPRKFSENEIRKAQQVVEDACTGLPGSDVSEKILKWEKENKISGETLKKIIDTEVVDRTKEIERLFERQVFSHLSTKVENKGVIYKTTTGEPWSAYSCYQGNHTSLHIFNIDRPTNKHWLTSTLCHEYEHHVAALFREKFYRQSKSLDLTAMLWYGKQSIISEGTASCADDFLGLQSVRERLGFMGSLFDLDLMVRLNVAYMLNVEGVDDETAIGYWASVGFASIDHVKPRIGFSKPLTPSGKPNFFKPYIYTYFFGRRNYVLPTFQKSQKKGKLKDFFQTLYLNPYSRSTATWEIAFSKI